MRDHSYHRETGVRELVAGDNSLFVAGFAGAEICSGYSAPLRRGLFIMRIERAEGDKDPVRSLSPIHPLCLARSIFLRLSLSLSSLPFPRQYHRFFETDVLTYTSYIRPCASIRFFLDSHILLVGIEEPRQDNETTRRAKCRDISRGVEVRRKKGILLHRIRVSSRYRACSAYRSFIMGIKYVRGTFLLFLPSFLSVPFRVPLSLSFVFRSFSPSTPPVQK